jgi:hypothetical protein
VSANLYWQPIKGRDLNVHAPSSFIEALGRAGFDLPCNLSGADVPMLRGLAAGMSDDNSRKAVERLIDAIEQHETISLWAEY